MQRRAFLKHLGQSVVLATAPAWGAGQVKGANERLRIGLIGCGGRGKFVARHLRAAGAQIVAVRDVYENQSRAANQEFGGNCRLYRDSRKVLEQPDIDAVLIATPDHWHAIPTVLACQAGKDVYVEKPLGHNIREGQAMLKAARESGRIVQAGTQQRSAPQPISSSDISPQTPATSATSPIRPDASSHGTRHVKPLLMMWRLHVYSGDKPGNRGI